MPTVTIANTDANLTSDTLLTAENSETKTGLLTFDRDPSAPFAVSSGSAVVTNLDADKVDGVEASDLARISTANAFTAVQTAAAQPRCRLSNSAVQSVSNDTLTVLTWDTETFDVGALHSTGSNTDRITVPTGGDGLWLIIAGANFAADADGYRLLQITKNGTVIASAQAASAAAGANTMLSVSALHTGVATDIYRAQVHHTAGAALNVGGDAGVTTFFAAVKLW